MKQRAKRGLLVATILLLTTPTVYGYGYYQNQLFLTVQKEGLPLFKAVHLAIYKVSKVNQRELVYSSRRHTAVLPLPPGHYEASARYENREVHKPFNLQTHEEHYLTLNMD